MEPITKYFSAEKYESILFVAVGLFAISFSIYGFVKLKHAYYIGMAYPLIAIAFIQIIVGASIYFRSPKDIIRVNQIIQSDQTKIQSEEIPRMQVVMNNFVIYRWVEIVLLASGILLFLFFPVQTFWKGVGLGLMIQAGMMLLLDYFAESRGKVYLQFLQSFL